MRLLWLAASMKNLDVILVLLPTDSECLEVCHLISEAMPLVEQARRDCPRLPEVARGCPRLPEIRLPEIARDCAPRRAGAAAALVEAAAGHRLSARRRCGRQAHGEPDPAAPRRRADARVAAPHLRGAPTPTCTTRNGEDGFLYSGESAPHRPPALMLAYSMPRGSCLLDVESRGSPGPCPTTSCVRRIGPHLPL